MSYSSAKFLRILLAVLGILGLLGGLVCLAFALLGDFGRDGATERLIFVAAAFNALSAGALLLLGSLITQYIADKLGILKDPYDID